MIAFSYDMVGYNDTRFADPAPDAASQPLPSYKEHRAFGTNAVDQLWNISLMGLQTWNSIRALDFLESLPDVDKKRLACTGESGGGTQTFMLGAIDRRLAAQAPVVMVSHTMQGGCSCENAPGLRVDYSNMEIAAVPAPRPQILVAASGDWTKDTMTVEGPAIEKVYNLFDATDKFRYVRFDFNHNYNQTSREAVYEWFGRFLLHSPDRASLKEAPYTKEPDDDLRVFPRGKQPPDTVTAQALVTQVIAAARKNLADEKPTNKKTLADFKDEFAPAWRHTLKVTIPDTTPSAESAGDRNAGKISMARFTVAAPRGRTVPVTLLQVAATRQPRIAVLVDHRGKSAFLAENGEPKGLAAVLLQRDVSVLVFDAFLTGDLANQALSLQRKPFENFFTTYNRTDLQERVQDIVTACAFAKGKGSKVVLVGQGRGGLWALLAAPAADAVIADVDGHDTTSDEALLAQDLFAPGLRRIGDFAGAATLAAPHPLCVYNTAERFQTQWLRDVYQAVGAQQEIKVETAALDDQKVADWVGRVR